MEKDDRIPSISPGALIVPPSTLPSSGAFQFTVAFLLAVSTSAAAAVPDESGPFRAPWRMQDVAAATCVTAGDFDGDGRWEVASVHGDGRISFFFRDAAWPFRWSRQMLDTEVAPFSVAAADLDADGDHDLLLADPGRTLFTMRAEGGGSFGKAQPIEGLTGVRAAAIGDWNGDGMLEFAAAEHDAHQVSVFLQLPGGAFSRTPIGIDGEPHAIAALDFDGDGKRDIAVGLAERGVYPLRGAGDGSFDLLPVFGNAPVRAIAAGDLDGDGKDDIASLPAEGGGEVTVRWSGGDGTFGSLQLPGTATEAAIADLDADGCGDLLLLMGGSLVAFPGKRDGKMDVAIRLQERMGSSSLIAPDFDGDGAPDIISQDVSFGITVLPSVLCDPFEMAFPTAPMKSLAVADLDVDGLPDLLLPSSAKPLVAVHLAPGTGILRPADIEIAAANVYAFLEAPDLDGDGTPDLAGAGLAPGAAHVALLSREGKVRREASFPVCSGARGIAAGRVDPGTEIDIALPCMASNTVALFLDPVSRGVSGSSPVPTVERPRAAALADLDGDGTQDLLVAGSTQVGIHLATAGGGVGDLKVLDDRSVNGGPIMAADVDGDGATDILLAMGAARAIDLLRGKGGGAFEPPESMDVEFAPVSIDAVDLDGDGRLDLVAASSSIGMASVFLGSGAGEFLPPIEYILPFCALGHRLADMDLDGCLDLIAFSAGEVTILAGARLDGDEPRFLRGDATGGGKLDLSDAVAVLEALFLGGPPVGCEDAADSNDDGRVDLSDPVTLLGSLFLGAGALPAPSAGCGLDPTPDGLGCGQGC
jgi:hypothetical protein